MVTSKSSYRILPYTACAIALIALTIGIKVLVAFWGEKHLYATPILGGVLKSLEIIELSNLLVFAILGLGIGAATTFLSAQAGQRASAILLILIVPLIFSASYSTRYHLWVEQVAAENKVAFAQAEAITNAFLADESNSEGFIGFFLYTAKVPVLPIDAAEIKGLTGSEKRVRSELTRFSGVEPGFFVILFNLVGWGIRFFYILLSIITVAIYFHKGLTGTRSKSNQSG
ncbi:MAG: hypothetical protein F6K19_39715 [Cyanothece sp. SIO1E1]|nr:hypothetical protein [Cyanothece sp. SIO1E1]